MRAVLQRVTEARVTVGGETSGAIGPGLVVLLGVERGDDASRAEWLARRVAELRLFRAGEKHFDVSLVDAGLEALVVSQFTLLADVSRGRRPDFTRAETGAVAEPLVARFCEVLRALGVRVAEGRFGADMLVSLTNDGPVTITVEGR